MLRIFWISGLLMSGSIAMSSATNAAQTGPATSSAPAAAATPVAVTYSTAGSDIGSLLDNPVTKAILDKHLPQLTANAQIEMARSMTLKQIQGYAGDMITDEVLAKIDADLAKLPAAK